MSTKRSYHDGCAMAHALNLIGERWALLVVRELLLGPRRFTDLRGAMPGISANVLTQRLTELERFGVLARRKLDPPANAWVYELTTWGQDLEPAILSLGRWASGSPSFPVGAQMGPDSLVLALKTAFQPEKADGLEASYELWLGEIPFNLAVKGGSFEAARGEAEAPDAKVRSDPNTIASVVFGGNRLGKAEEAGAVEIDGSRQAVRALFKALT